MSLYTTPSATPPGDLSFSRAADTFLATASRNGCSLARTSDASTAGRGKFGHMVTASLLRPTLRVLAGSWRLGPGLGFASASKIPSAGSTSSRAASRTSERIFQAALEGSHGKKMMGGAGHVYTGRPGTDT